jgi:feruloyl esterase
MRSVSAGCGFALELVMKSMFLSVLGVVLMCVAACAPSSTDSGSSPGPSSGVVSDSSCDDLLLARDVTLIYARVVAAADEVPEHCYAKGLIDGSITFHVQLPLGDAWNGRLVHLGDGGADGDLDFGGAFVARGYAVANSNTGHDAGALGEAYGFGDERAATNFVHRAVHGTTAAAKTVVRHFYGRSQDYAYHYGCSTGGRQGLVAAQVYPYDFDGIVAGAPGHRQFERMAHRLDVLRHLLRDGRAANLAFDADGDGREESLAKLGLLTAKVLDKCDAADGIEDGIVEQPLCDFDSRRDLESLRCQDGDGEDCLTDAQLEAVHHLYEGSRNSRGELVYPGAPILSEASWAGVFVPHAGNDFVPYALRSAANVIAYTFHRDDPGLLPPDLSDLSYELDRDAGLPEWGWWEVDLDDVGSPRSSELADIMRGTDADLERFLLRGGGKLLMYHGWADAVIPPEPTIEYHEDVIESTFGGDAAEAAEHVRLFMAPGVAHCRGGNGPDRADYLGALADWVERDIAPDRIVAHHETDGVLDNERPLCPWPQRAVYTGPEGGQNDSANWREGNFECR